MTVEQIHAPCCGKTLAAALHLPDGPRPACVIVSHGLFSSKDSPKLVAVGEYFSAHGIAVLRYDHRGCGQSEGDVARTTVASRLADLACMADLASDHPRLGESIGLLGSSMGGFISLLHTERDSRIRALALWSTPAFIRHPERDAPPGSALQRAAFLADARDYDARELAPGVHTCLILHGGADDLVPPFHAQAVHRAVHPPKRLEVFPGADHKFSDPDIRTRATRLSFRWFRNHL